MTPIPQKVSEFDTPPEHRPLMTAGLALLWTWLPAFLSLLPRLSLIQQNLSKASHKRLPDGSSMIPGNPMTADDANPGIGAEGISGLFYGQERHV